MENSVKKVTFIKDEAIKLMAIEKLKDLGIVRGTELLYLTEQIEQVEADSKWETDNDEKIDRVQQCTYGEIQIDTRTLGVFGQCVDRMTQKVTVNIWYEKSYGEASYFVNGVVIRQELNYKHRGGGSNGKRTEWVLNMQRNQRIADVLESQELEGYHNGYDYGYDSEIVDKYSWQVR